MNVFEVVKQSVTTRQAAEHYGVRVGRTGMCVCPFHDDKNPSMKVDRRFHCFGCQADGDVIGLCFPSEKCQPQRSALMLAQDFSIPYEDKEPPSRSRRPKPRQKQESPEQQFKRMERYCFRVLSDYHNLLRRWKRDYAPRHRTRNGTRFSWKPCRNNPMWNICWMCCCSPTWRNVPP